MGIFAQYGDFEGASRIFQTARGGGYICTLLDIELIERTNFGSAEGASDFRFVFETVQALDDDGFPFRFFKRTGTKYGDEKSSLTVLLNGMVGHRLSVIDFDFLDVEHLRRSLYRVTVTEDEDQEAPGRFHNTIIAVKREKVTPGLSSVPR